MDFIEFPTRLGLKLIPVDTIADISPVKRDERREAWKASVPNAYRGGETSIHFKAAADGYSRSMVVNQDYDTVKSRLADAGHRIIPNP